MIAEHKPSVGVDAASALAGIREALDADLRKWGYGSWVDALTAEQRRRAEIMHVERERVARREQMQRSMQL